MSETKKLRGQPQMSDAHKEKIRAISSLPKSEETKKKMSDTRKLYWQHKKGVGRALGFIP